MNKRLGAFALTLGVGGALAGGAVPAYAGGNSATQTLTATVTASQIGSRTVTVNPVTAFASALGSAGMTTSATMVVTEAAVQGANPWSVTAYASDFSNGTNTIPATSLTAVPAAPVVVNGGGTVTAGSTGNLGGGSSSPLGVLSDVQNTSTLYTGTYTEVLPLTLTPPNGTVASATPYSSTLTVTLSY